ncbi:DUF4124 domain-containing protein [Arhodomonas sp. AD133]|uniref:DUF4124 domain-containing protein n=1 Tax=Arhodomonas sp. AD133 TaxID=3415009 RepID=UPI003EBA2EED
MLVALLVTGVASAGVYKWVDEDGNVHFTDKPSGGQSGEEVEFDDINSYEAPSLGEMPQWIDSRNDTSDRVPVVMYATQWCPYCKKARQYFKDNDIAYTEYDVENSRKGKRDYKRMGEPGVPIIFIGDTRMNGFSASRFETVYRRKTGD